LSPFSIGEVFAITLIALTLVAHALVALIVVVFTVLAIAGCLLSTAITRLPAAHLLLADAGAAAASSLPAEQLLPLMALYFIMADCYVIALVPMPSSHCPSHRYFCHCIVIASRPDTLMEECLLKKEKAEKVFLITAQNLKKAIQIQMFGNFRSGTIAHKKK
jgi:hypothetical protein